MTSDLWLRGCEQLALELPEQQFNTWNRPLLPADVSEVADSGNAVVVSVRVHNRFKLDWIRSQYAGRIEDLLGALAGRTSTVFSSVQRRGKHRFTTPMFTASLRICRTILKAGYPRG